MTGFVEAVRRANAPQPPEHSVRLRLACSAAVSAGLLSAAVEGEIARPAAALAIAAFAAGMVFSHRSRERSAGAVKLLVAVGAVAAMVWFISRLASGPHGDITSVEALLTVLFAWVLVVHSFHVPARRDLLFALAGSAALMAVAGAQAVDMGFAPYALAWSGLALWGLLEMGASATGARRPPVRQVLASAGAVVAVAVLVFLALPAPAVVVRLDFRSAAGSAGAVPGVGALAGDSGSPVELSHPGSPAGRTRVGGYLGFAGDLDTAARATLGRHVVMEVRASVPSFWVGETFDRWNGQSWSSSSSRTVTLNGGSPFSLPPAGEGQSGPGADDLQTFYIKDATANLVFHADQAEELWFPASRLYYGRDGALVSPIGLGQGAVYTVDSLVRRPTASDLRRTPAPYGAPGGYLQLPEPYTDVGNLARSVTAGDGTEYDKVQSLIAWIGTHTRYSLDIPPLAPGTDAVREFLFGNRTGYCEQISTSLTVMLRTLGIPAREAVGYVPGDYNPVTDLYVVRAEDAHAWVQAYFSGYGWVSFDPTAVVPDANPSPGTTALHIAGHFLADLPWTGISAGAMTAALLAGAGWWAVRLRARRRLTPSAAALERMERAGKRSGRPRRPSETVTEYGTALGGRWPDVARAVDAATFGDIALPAGVWTDLLGAAEAGPIPAR